VQPNGGEVRSYTWAEAVEASDALFNFHGFYATWWCCDKGFFRREAKEEKIEAFICARAHGLLIWLK
ncbi:MAG: hypothetical protein AABZ59_08150, partial [Candidatus Binatota bacterium]